MKKSSLLNLALSALIAFSAPAGVAKPVEYPIPQEVAQVAQEYGMPPIPENTTVLFRKGVVLMAYYWGMMDVVKDRSLGAEEREERMNKLGEKFIPMLGNVMFRGAAWWERQPQGPEEEKWQRAKEEFMKWGEEDPSAYLALLAIIRNGKDKAPADMRTDEFAQDLIAKAKSGGDVIAHYLDACNHIWGFYGVPVDEAAALAGLRKVAFANLREAPNGWFQVLSQVGNLCREGNVRIPLRVTATALANYLHTEKSAGPTDGSVPYAFGRALTEKDPERPLSGVGGMYFGLTVLGNMKPEDLSAAVYVLLEKYLRSEGDEQAELMHARAVEMGADFDRDYLVPLKPEYFLSLNMSVDSHTRRYMTEEEDQYFDALGERFVEAMSKMIDGAEDESVKETYRQFFSKFLGGFSDEDAFHFMETTYLEAEKWQPGAEAYVLLFGLYSNGCGASKFGKDEEKALSYLRKAVELGDPMAILIDIDRQLEEHPEPTEEQINKLMECGTEDSAFRLYELKQEYPEKFEDVEPGTGRYLLSYALVRGVQSAWRVIAQEMEGPDGDEQARIIARALAVAAEEGNQEDYMELDDALQAYAVAHPEVKDIVDLLRMVVLEFAMDASRASKTAKYIRPCYASAAPGELSREIARRLESLVSADLPPDEFAEYHRRLEIDIQKAAEDEKKE